MSLWDTVDEPLRAHLGLSRDLVAGHRETALKRVGLASHDGRAKVAAAVAVWSCCCSRWHGRS